MVDGRYKSLRPRTQEDPRSVDQPVSWQGLDPVAKRTVDPVRTFETPLVFFPAEVAVLPGSSISIPLPPRCAQIAFINLVPNVAASFNGGGSRTIKDGFVMNGEFSSLDIATDVAGTCLIQLGCY